MSRIQLTDTLKDAYSKMAEGNPGAMTVCLQSLKNNAVIDPDSDDGLGELAPAKGKMPVAT